MTKPKILILTSNYGSGHLQVASSLENQFNQMGNHSIIVKDLIYETSPKLNEWTRKAYLKSYTASGRHLYRIFYYSSMKMSKKKNLKVLCYGYSKLKKIILEERPDIIINTFPFFAAPFLQNKMKVYIPTYNVITDYCLHDLWYHPQIHKYYVASRHLESKLIALGVKDNQVAVTGIPVKEAFEKPLSRERLVKEYGLDHTKKNVLVVAGAYGVSKGIQQICSLLSMDKDTQLLIVCGKNNDLYRQMSLSYENEKNVKVFSYVNNMEELLKVSDCIITKPGGVILSEALATNTPLILPKATPGQEKENAKFFQQIGAAIWEENPSRLCMLTRELICNETKLLEMKHAMEKLYRPNSSKKIAMDILTDYHNHYNIPPLMKHVEEV
ncbi:glycosyltransferase [Evansella sp. AB-rgal1]|uniref:MGDG synthase family glycosyltransferase n=1 Tax=Evansella sp. AB-rgal1 TaxID=3242696 RepID=UPI00359E3233